jgi:aldose 1-epimerase
MKKLLFFSGLAVIILVACNNGSDTSSTETTNKMDSTAPTRSAGFHQTLNGKEVSLYVLKNKKNATAELTNYGARLVSLMVPDKNGNMVDVILGHDSLSGYAKPGESFFGTTIGRYGNRIAKAKFKLDGKEYKLDANNGPNSLHGGRGGFNTKVWDVVSQDPQSITFSYLSKDGEEGYPGNLTSKVKFTLTDENAIQIDYEATTDANTVVNLTNHSYFNLNGAGSGTINNHEVMINADNFSPVDATLIPTKMKEKVDGTPFDFRKPTTIAARVDDTSNVQIRYGKGYDHNFVLNGWEGQ